MDCKDLMVGDLVYIHEPKCKGHRINYISEVDEEVGADGEVYDECDIRPIPLTEDILVKNGYKSTQGIDFYWLDEKKHCCIKNYDGKRLFCYKQGMNDVWLVVKYVHTLQHLLRLVGIEKELIID